MSFSYLSVTFSSGKPLILRIVSTQKGKFHFKKFRNETENFYFENNVEITCN